jgi:hypothetical protein
MDVTESWDITTCCLVHWMLPSSGQTMEVTPLSSSTNLDDVTPQELQNIYYQIVLQFPNTNYPGFSLQPQVNPRQTL